MATRLILGHDYLQLTDDQGRLHGAPALRTPRSTEYYWHGRLHRTDGPAMTVTYEVNHDYEALMHGMRMQARRDLAHTVVLEDYYWHGQHVTRTELKRRRRRLLWGVLRCAPMLMLWRKRAAEAVWHPSRLSFTV